MAEQGTGDSEIWTWIGKAAALLTVIWILVQAYNHFFSKPDFRLTAQGNHYSLSFPKPLLEPLKDFATCMNDAQVFEKILKGSAEYDPYPQARKISELVSKQFPKDSVQALGEIRSVWTVVIKNTGHKQVDALALELPFDGFSQVSRSDRADPVSKFERTINLASLRPGNDIKVIVWSDSPEYRSQEALTRVTHPNGSISIDYPREVTGVLAWIDRELPFLTFFIPFALAIVLIVVCVVNLIPQQKAKQTPKQDTQEPDTVTPAATGGPPNPTSSN